MERPGRLSFQCLCFQAYPSSFGNCVPILALVILIGTPAHVNPAPQTDFGHGFSFNANSKTFKRGSDSDSDFFGGVAPAITFGASSASASSNGATLAGIDIDRQKSQSQFAISFSGGSGIGSNAPGRSVTPGPVSAPLILAPPSTITLTKPVHGLGLGVQQTLNLSKLCPQINGATSVTVLTRYDAAARKCGTIGFREHCPENMMFYSFPENKIHGGCDCIYEVGNQKPFVYNAKEDKCFQIFEQGYCKPGQWITPSSDGDGEPICTRTRCQNIFAGIERQNSTDFVLYKGECVRLNEPFRSCQQSEIIGFSSGDLEPKCRPKVVISTKGVGSVKSLKCAPGTFLSVTGKCQKGWSWD